MNWKLVISVSTAAAAGTLVAEFLVGSPSPLLVALTLAVALAAGMLLSLMLRIGARKKDKTGAG